MNKQTTRRTFIKQTAITTTGLFITGCAEQAVTTQHIRPDRPNIIFIFTESPIDTKLSRRLSSTGTTFTNAYSQGAWNDDIYTCASTMFKTESFLWKAKKHNTQSAQTSLHRSWPSVFADSNYNLNIDDVSVIHKPKPFFLLLTSDADLEKTLNTVYTHRNLKNTYIFYTTTNITSKATYDITQPLPLIITGPKIPHGKSIDTPIYIQDIVPTTYALSGIRIAVNDSYQSLIPTLKGEFFQPCDALYFAFKDTRRVLIKDGYKLDLYPQEQTAFLYNLSDDPINPRNVIDDPANKTLKDKLLRKLFDLQKQTGDDLYLRGIYANLLHCPIC